MERIVYKKTLDVHKNGLQFTLQGFETADKMSRVIEISLMASGDTINIPLEQVEAIMYVTTPNATEPSLNKCTIKDDSIIYDVLPIVEEGITEMQLKLIETGPDGATSVLATPKFAVEVLKSNVDDEGAMQITTFTALEDAVAKAKATYDGRLLRIELDADCVFRGIYADGTVYETDILKELFLRGDVLLSQSYAKGGSGVRAGEDTDNSMYYSRLAKSSVSEAEAIREDNRELLAEVQKHGVYTAFSVDFESGEVKYVSPHYKFNIDQESGELEAIGEAYSFEGTIELLVMDFLTRKGADIETLKDTDNDHETRITWCEDYINDEFIYKKGFEILANVGQEQNICGYTLDDIRSYKLVEVYLDYHLTGNKTIKVLCNVSSVDNTFEIRGIAPCYNGGEGGEIYLNYYSVEILGTLDGVSGTITDWKFIEHSTRAANPDQPGECYFRYMGCDEVSITGIL